MAKGRTYAENLVGPLDRSFYETQRNVANKVNETNWQNLQNQYKNLTDQLKRKQEQENIAFAKGLVDVSENSLDRMSAANQNMANRGLTSSGLTNLVEQADTTAKGSQVLDLLGKAGDVAVSTAGQMASGNATYADKAAELNNALAGTLGDINAGDVAAQMSYNKGLADLGEAMEAREDDNKLQAAQRAASAASSGNGTKEQDDEYNEFMRRVAINQTLISDTMDDKDKANVLRIRLGVKNADEVIKAYNKNIGETERYNKDLKAAKNKIKKAEQDAKNNIAKENLSNFWDWLKGVVIGTPMPESDEPLKADKSKNKGTTPADVLFGTSYEIPESDKPLPNASEKNKNKNKEIEKKAKEKVKPITYEELAELLYGKK